MVVLTGGLQDLPSENLIVRFTLLVAILKTIKPSLLDKSQIYIVSQEIPEKFLRAKMKDILKENFAKSPRENRFNFVNRSSYLWQ